MKGKAALVYDAIVSILAVAVIVAIAVSGATLINAIGGWVAFMTVWICVIATDIRTLKRRKKMNENTKAIAEQKAIEDMARDLCGQPYSCQECKDLAVKYAKEADADFAEFLENESCDLKGIAIKFYKAGYRKQSETVKEFAEKAINSLNKYCYIPRQVSFDAGFIEGIKQAQATLMELAEQYGKEEK